MKHLYILQSKLRDKRGKIFFQYGQAHKKNEFLKSLYIWMKKLLSVLIYFKKIEFILIRI